jgi:predicted nucleic acid-binding protein
MIGIDTNLLIYAHRGGSPEHHAAVKALEKAIRHPSGWGIPLLCLGEFWAVVTHPKCPGGPSSLEDAYGFVKNLIEDGNGFLWLPKDTFAFRWLQIARDLKVSGARIFDLQVALISFENGATEIWTHDQGFQTIPGLTLHDPLSK